MARKKNKAALPLGIITFILAIIGFITVVGWAVGFVSDRKTNMNRKDEFEELLTPVVMFAPDPFDDLTQADKSQLLYAAVWDLLLDESGTSKYSYSQGETFGIVVPQDDIKVHFEKLFGDEIDLDPLHGTIDMSGYDISYDAALKSYILPITGVDSAYVPEIYSIDKQGSSFVLTVGYIGNKAWADIKNDEFATPEADRTMKITLRERSGKLFVASIQDTDIQEAAAKFTTTRANREDLIDEEETDYFEPEVTEEITEATEPSYVEVTDENGETVTDENGEAVTETVPSEESTEESEESTGEVTEE